MAIAQCYAPISLEKPKNIFCFTINSQNRYFLIFIVEKNNHSEECINYLIYIWGMVFRTRNNSSKIVLKGN